MHSSNGSSNGFLSETIQASRRRIRRARGIGLAVLAFVDTTTDPLDRTGKPFQLRNIPSGAAITQRLEVGSDGLDEIRLDGEMTPGRGPGVLNAQLVEVEDNGTAIGVVRSAKVELAPGATVCCVIRFEPIRDSRWRAYRLDVNVGELNGRQLTLSAVRGRSTGRLTINGHPQTAFLLFRTKATEGTGWARLRMTSAGRRLTLMALALIYNAVIAAAVYLVACINWKSPEHNGLSTESTGRDNGAACPDLGGTYH
jgi:hypothetical protein